MPRMLESLLIVAWCLLQCGCTSYRWHCRCCTEDELLAEFGMYEAAGPLSPNPKTFGFPVRNPDWLVGRWRTRYEMEQISYSTISSPFDTEGLVKNQLETLKRSAVDAELDFESNGTVLAFQGISRKPDEKPIGRGTWHFQDGKLLLTYEGTEYMPAGVTQKLEVWARSPDEIVIGHASVASMRSNFENFEKHRKIGSKPGLKKSVYGWDSRGYAVYRAFYNLSSMMPQQYRDQGADKEDEYDFVCIHATQPQIYKRLKDYGAAIGKSTTDTQSLVARSVKEEDPQAQVKVPYTIESIKWDDQKEFECQFVVVLKGEPSLDMYSQVQHELEASMRKAYLRMHPSVDASTIYVDVRPSLADGRIVGRATVLGITPVSLHYDENSRKGNIAVRFNPGQADAARHWIRLRIEILARDKNIALKTGQPPPDATYCLGNEKIDGDVMTIEFKTE